MFQRPESVRRPKPARQRPTPLDWKEEIEDKWVEILPLVDKLEKQYEPGWCTYTYAYAECPELEVICGGINSQTPRAGAIWRQGNLLHFGFQQSPAEMNATGQAILVNAIVYISGFTEDRPIARTPSGFAGPAPRSRDTIIRLVKRFSETPRLSEYLGFYVGKDLTTALAAQGKEDMLSWYEKQKPFIHAQADGKLAIDEEARQFGTSAASPDFFLRAIESLRTGENEALALRLLARYAPDGPGADTDAKAWGAWWDENKPYLFFSDAGWYRWYIDPLAKKRGVPSADLRGPARATHR